MLTYRIFFPGDFFIGAPCTVSTYSLYWQRITYICRGHQKAKSTKGWTTKRTTHLTDGLWRGFKGFRFWRKTDEMTKTGHRNKNIDFWRNLGFVEKKFFPHNSHFLTSEKWHFWWQNPLEPNYERTLIQAMLELPGVDPQLIAHPQHTQIMWGRGVNYIQHAYMTKNTS